MKSMRSHVIIIVGYVTDRSRNQFKQLITKDFISLLVQPSPTPKKRVLQQYQDKEEVHRTLGSQPMFWGLVDIADYLKVGLCDI